MKSFQKQYDESIYNILTKREIEVITLVAKGHTNKKIAKKLFISCDTVNNHFRNIREKSKQKTLAGATCFALQRGLII